ncbi:lysophospholipid acyltransferase family protein [Bacillus xiapuensis]|uniref:lysophospholipid acyltransferase family protein n=1 Tax=Bacillus xiapuensis TaxID=2014075 RepID=UPI000C244EBB|nr:lysophospholipid acyltransferase family protein [Bacillus xiapuensis]
MFRIIYFVLFLMGTLVGSLPTLRRNKALAQSHKAEYDKQIHELPKRWARSVVRQTGSGVSISGQEHLPEGAVLFVSNHEGDFDVPALLGYIEKPFGFISKVEMKKVPIIRDWMEALHCIYINRENRRDAVKMLRDGIQILKSGHSLLIFPEGTRSKGGELKPFKSGAFRMAKEARIPIVPIAIKGTSHIFEKNNRKKLTPAQIVIEILPALDPDIFEEYELKKVAAHTQQLIQMSLSQMK